MVWLGDKWPKLKWDAEYFASFVQIEHPDHKITRNSTTIQRSHAEETMPLIKRVELGRFHHRSTQNRANEWIFLNWGNDEKTIIQPVYENKKDKLLRSIILRLRKIVPHCGRNYSTGWSYMNLFWALFVFFLNGRFF